MNPPLPGRAAVRPVRAVRLGLAENLPQFSLLVLVNAFVGGMVGIERAVLPLVAEHEFGLASRSAILSFIVTFGLVKAALNLFAGHAADLVGRKPLLLAGWLAGAPVPLLLMWAPSWGWITAANVLLGVNQGLCWSTLVIMKIDLAGPARRGLAMGLNEFAGYVALAAAALGSAALAQAYALRPQPFYLGVVFAGAGLVLSLAAVRETRGHARAEAEAGRPAAAPPAATPPLREVFAWVSFRDRTLMAASQAGLVNNLNDGMVWGLLPLFLARAGLDLAHIGTVAAIYPAVWGAGQLATGALSDRIGRKGLVVAGLWLQAAALAGLAAGRSYAPWLGSAALLGLGTAMVYPTLLAAVGDLAPPSWRASAVGVYRFWRDLGYAAGALGSGALADALGLEAAILAVAGLTFLSGLVTAAAMRETLGVQARGWNLS